MSCSSGGRKRTGMNDLQLSKQVLDSKKSQQKSRRALSWRIGPDAEDRAGAAFIDIL